MKCYACTQDLDAKQYYHLHLSCFEQIFDVQGMVEFNDFSRLSTGVKGSLDDDRDSSRDSQFHGHYPKYTARLGSKRFILKFGKSGSYPLLAEAEALSNAIASAMGIAVARPHGMIEYNGRNCFVVRDFLDRPRPCDLVHLWDFWPLGSQGRGPYLLSTLIEVLGQHVSYREVATCLELILFDYLIGNGDRHRSNIAVLREANSKTTIAPFYDNVSDLGLEEPEMLDPKMKWHPSIKVELDDGKTDIYSYLDLMRLKGFEDMIRRFKSRVKIRGPQILTIIEEGAAHPNLKACMADLWQRRSQELLAWK